MRVPTVACRIGRDRCAARGTHTSFHRCFQSTGRAGAPCHGPNLGCIHFRPLRRVNRFSGRAVGRGGRGRRSGDAVHRKVASRARTGTPRVFPLDRPATSATSEQTASEGPAAIDACSDARTTSKKSARSGSKPATLYALAQFGFSRREALSVCCIDEAPILRGWSEWCVWMVPLILRRHYTALR